VHWEKPLENNFLNSKTFIFHKKWNYEEYPYIIRWYNYFGDIDEYLTLKELNNNTYTKVPSDILLKIK
jgi:hemolysin-activating ACP:hemolysin acyltransferase